VKDNQIYYFEVGKGDWSGKFSFAIKDWKGFRKSRMTFKYKCLVIIMNVVNKVFGQSKIKSTITATSEMEKSGIANNDYHVSKFGLTVFYSNEDYVLNMNGSDVIVKPKERFGPIPFLFRENDEYTAQIHADGMSSTYFIKLLGDNWIGIYTVAPDKKHVKGVLNNGWATVEEDMYKEIRGQTF
jgi:hypothetical protein